MIIIEIHLLSAITGRKSKLGEMSICNDGTGSLKRSHYVGEIKRKPDFHKVTRIGRVENYPRLDKPVWCLVAQMLNRMGYGK